MARLKPCPSGFVDILSSAGRLAFPSQSGNKEPDGSNDRPRQFVANGICYDVVRLEVAPPTP
jgi:hypothetical protein